MKLYQVIDRVKEVLSWDKDNGREVLARNLLVDILKIIATGQCKDYPPEDFAEEALKVFGIDRNMTKVKIRP